MDVRQRAVQRTAVIYLITIEDEPPRCFNYLSEATEWYREIRRLVGEFNVVIEGQQGKVCPGSSTATMKEEFGEPA